MHMDEYWLSFRADQTVKLWDCHNDQLHDLNGLIWDQSASTAYYTHLESRPGEIPIVVSWNGNEINVFDKNGFQAKIQDTSSQAQGGHFIEGIENNRVFLAGCKIFNLIYHRAHFLKRKF